ncbi:hypothetical protein NC653_035502 [Populus alba x Populus x berolinensis]|uniref:Uncharacterized protein n=1 Tax=Populus alba x Populus x berolinensis TaxID=444605 RepID=A0AAD6LRB5_9ROSI|nr:hypothetical protein NC653_035502 [Populus alba x Populus x berolinensis]
MCRRWYIHNLAKQISQEGRFGSDSWVGFVTWKLLSSITLPSGHYDLALTYTKVTILWSHFFLLISMLLLLGSDRRVRLALR